MFKNIAYIPNDLFAFNQQKDKENFYKLSLYVNQVINDHRDPIFFETFDGDQFKGNQLALLSELLMLVLEHKCNRCNEVFELIFSETRSEFSEEKFNEICELFSQLKYAQPFFNVCEKWIAGQNQEFDFSNADNYDLTDPPELFKTFISSLKQDVQETVKQMLSQFVSTDFYDSLIQIIKRLILNSDGNGSFKAINKFSHLNNRYNKLSERLKEPYLDPDKDKANNDKILSKIYPDISVQKDDISEESQYAEYLIQHQDAFAAIPKDSHFVQTIFDQHSSKLCCLLIIDNLDKKELDSFLKKTLEMYQFSDRLYCLRNDFHRNEFYIESMTMVECLALYLKEVRRFLLNNDSCFVKIKLRIKLYLKQQNTALNLSASLKITDKNLYSEHYQLFSCLNVLIQEKVIHLNQTIPWINNLFNDYLKLFIPSNSYINPSNETMLVVFNQRELGLSNNQFNDCFPKKEYTIDLLFQYLYHKNLDSYLINDDSQSSKDLFYLHIFQTYFNYYCSLLKNMKDEMDQIQSFIYTGNINSGFDFSKCSKQEKLFICYQFKSLNNYLNVISINSQIFEGDLSDYIDKLKRLLNNVHNLFEILPDLPPPTSITSLNEQHQRMFFTLMDSIKSNHLTLDSSELHNDEEVNVFLNRLFSINFKVFNQKLLDDGRTRNYESQLNEISVAVTISAFHLFYLRSKPDQSIQLFKDSIEPWLKVYFLDPNFGQLFLVDILDELQFNFEKPAECYFRKLDIIMIRLLSEASVSYFKLINLVSNQLVNLPSESLNINELKSDFYKLLTLPFEFFDIGNVKKSPFLPIDFQREIGDEWYFISQIKYILNFNGSIYYGGLHDYKSEHPMKMFWTIVTFVVPLTGNRINKLVDYLRNFDNVEYDFKSAGMKLDVPVLTGASDQYYQLIEDGQKRILEFLQKKKSTDISNELKQLKSKCNVQFNLVVDQLMKSCFPYYNDQLKCTSQLFRLLMFPIIFELTTKQKDYSIQLFTDQTDDQIHDHLSSYFQSSYHDKILHCFQLDDDYQHYLVTVLSEAKLNSLWKSVSKEINIFMESGPLKNGKARYDKRQESIAVLNEFDNKKEFTNSPSKKKKKKKKKPSNGLNQPIHKMIDESTIEKVSIELNQPDDQLSQLKASSEGERIENLKGKGAHEQETDSILKTSEQSEKQPIQSLKYLIKRIDDLIIYLSDDGFQPVKSSKKGKAQMIELDWIEAINDLTSELNDLTIDISLPDNLSSKVDAVKFLKTLKRSITNQPSNHDSNDDTNELTDSLSQSSKNDTIFSLTDSISNAESEISDISSNSFVLNNTQVDSLAIIQSNTLPIDDQHDLFEDMKFGQFAEEVIINDKDVPLDKNNQLNVPIKQSTTPPNQSIALANQSTPSLHPAATITYQVKFGLPKDLNQQIILERIQKTLSSYKNFNFQSTQIISILDQWENKIRNENIPLDIRNIYCEWLFGAMNSIKSINQGSFNQEIQRYNQSCTTNFSYFNTVLSTTNSYPFLDQFCELSKIYKGLFLFSYHPRSTNSDALLIKIIINKSIYILKKIILDIS